MEQNKLDSEKLIFFGVLGIIVIVIICIFL